MTTEDGSTVVTHTENNAPNDASIDATVVAPQSGAPALPAFNGRTTLKLLGVGGMARVYLARDEVLNRELAIKVMAGEMADDAEFHERFVEEAKIVAGFSHPNIVTIYGFGEIDSKSPYIEMAFEPGGALEDRLEQGEVSEEQAVAIAHKMAEALAYSHKHRVVHRDFKPANILFSENDEPVLSDFGIAKGIDVTDHRTQTGFQVGSPRYMSPEQLRGERVNDRTDVYSLGLVFWETLFGSLPNRQLASIRNEEDSRKLKEALVAADPSFGKYAEVLAACFIDDSKERPSAEEVAVMFGQLSRPRQSPRLSRILLGTVAASALIIGGLGLQLYSAEDYSLVNLEVVTTPADANVAIDGAGVGKGIAELRSGEHTVSATANGYLGVAELVTLGEVDETLQLNLAPLNNLTKEELFSFENQFMDGKPGTVPLTYPVFSRLMAMQTNAQSDPEAFKTDLQELAILHQRNDPAAKLMRFLLDFNGLIELEGDEAQAALNDASDSNYALATFYKAQIYRSDKEVANGGELYSVEAERYLRLLEQADRQGLSWARELIDIAKKNL